MIEKEPSRSSPVLLGAEPDCSIQPTSGVASHSDLYRSHISQLRELCSLRLRQPEHASKAIEQMYREVGQHWSSFLDNCIRPLIRADRADVVELDYEFREDGSSDPSFLGSRRRPAILLGHCVVEELIQPLLAELRQWHQRVCAHLKTVGGDQQATALISSLYHEYCSTSKPQLCTRDPADFLRPDFLRLCAASGLLSLDTLSIEETGINVRVVIPDNGFNRSGLVLLEGDIGCSVIFSSDNEALSKIASAEKRERDFEMLRSLGFPTPIAEYGVSEVESILTSIDRYQAMLALWSNLFPDRARSIPSHEQQIDHLVQAGLPVDLFEANLEIDVSPSHLQGDPISIAALNVLFKALGLSASQKAQESNQIDFEALEQLFRLDHDLWGVSFVKSSDAFGFGYALKLENSTDKQGLGGSEPAHAVSEGYEFTFNIEYESVFEPHVTDVELLVYNRAAADQDVRSYRGFEAKIVYQILRYSLGYTWPGSNGGRGVIDSEYEW